MSKIEPTLTADGVPFLRSPDANFAAIEGFSYRPNYLDINGLRMHYVDEGPRDGPVALLVHGMPTWSYLYRSIIPPMVAAGYRCIAPDHIGFGRSDKVTEPAWYSIARHTDNLMRLITTLDAQAITLVVQDWGGPIGLAQFARMPDRFSRLVIMNTWLHHDDYEYTPAIRDWIDQNLPGGLFRDNVPGLFNWGTLLAFATGRTTPQQTLVPILQGEPPVLTPDVDAVRHAYDAPFVGLGDAGVTGPRQFPISIPFHDPDRGDADDQAANFAAVNATTVPVHFVWGLGDIVFTPEWGRAWHSRIPQSTWDEFADATHFLQDTHGALIAETILRRSSQART